MSKNSNLPKRGFFDKVGDKISAISRKPWFLVCQITAASLLVILLIFYGASVLFANKSGFTISIGDDKDDKAAISLSEDKDFSNPTVRLDAGGIQEMTCISKLDLPEKFDSEGGSHNSTNYLAYTFYLKNSGNEEADIRSELNIKSVLYHADEAIRVRIYRNGNPTTYAKAAKDGNPEYDTVPFAEENKVFSVVEENVKAGEIIKYTIVVWLEGDDPECLDDIKGGNVKMSLTFSLDDAET